LTSVLFATDLLFILHYMWGIFHHAYAIEALVYTFVLSIAVGKRI